MSNEEENNSAVEFQNRTFLDKRDDNILIVTRGHPFERDPFFEMIDSTAYPWSHIEPVSYTHLTLPTICSV